MTPHEDDLNEGHVPMTTPWPKRCPNCVNGLLHPDTRDVTICRGTFSEIIPDVLGLFCDACDEIEFDASTDSAQRYAQAGDRLVLLNRSAQAAPLHVENDCDAPTIELTRRESERLAELLENPPPRNAKFLQAQARYREGKCEDGSEG